MSWPSSQDYNEAIQAPQTSFRDPELRGGEAAVNALGLPMPRSGNFADVYEFRCPQTGNTWALKCFTRHVSGLQMRYAEISQHVLQANLPFIVEFHYLHQGIRVRGEWYPLLKMRWVEGPTLNEFVRNHLDKPQMLELLCQLWQRLARRLREANVAHADLQHGNVLLVPGSKAGALAVKLIDYDGMWVPTLASTPSGEVGHPAYQHPQRLREGTYSPEVDRFPHLLIYTALRALRLGGRALWEKYDNGDNLLFRQQDLMAPQQSPLFRELLGMKDPGVRSLVEHLARAAQGPLERSPLLDDLLPGAPAKQAITAVAPVPRTQAVQAAAPAVVGEQPEAIFAAATADAGPPPARKERPTPVTGEGTRLPLPVLVGIAAGAGGLLVGVLVGAIVLLSVWRGGPPTAKEPLAQKDPVALVPATEPVRKEATATPRTEPATPRTEPTPPPRTDPPDRPAVPAGPKVEPAEGKPSVVAAAAPRPEDLVPGELFRWQLKYPGHNLAVSPGGRHAILSESGGATVLEIEGQWNVRRFPPQWQILSSGVFFPDGRQVLSWGMDNRFRVWSPEAGEHLRQFGEGGAFIEKLALSPDGRHLLSGGEEFETKDGQFVIRENQRVSLGNKVKLWDVGMGKELACLLETREPGSRAVGFTADGGRAFGFAGGQVVLWDMNRGQETRRLRIPGIKWPVAMSPDGHLLVFRKDPTTLKLWDLEADHEARSIPTEFDGSNALAFSADGRSFLTCGTKGSLDQWDVTAGKLLRRFTGHKGMIYDVAVFPDGRRAISVGADATARLWDLNAAGQAVKVAAPAPAPAPVPAAPPSDPEARREVHRWDFALTCGPGSFTKDGHRALICARTDLTLLDLENKKVVGAIRTDDVNLQGAALLPDGRRALTRGVNKTLGLWNLDTRQKVREFKGHTTRISDLAVSPDGKVALTSSGSLALGPDGKPVKRGNDLVHEDCVVRVWDVETGKELRRFEGHKTEVLGVRWVGDGGKALSCSLESTCLWDTKTGEESHRSKFLARLTPALTADGKQALFVAANGKLLLWDLENDTEVRTFDDPPELSCGVTLSPDGKLAVVFSSYGKIVVYDMASGRPIYLLEGIGQVGVNGVMISPDSRRALALSNDSTARLYDLTPKKAAAPK
jgi:WD40 repeat protein